MKKTILSLVVVLLFTTKNFAQFVRDTSTVKPNVKTEAAIGCGATYEFFQSNGIDTSLTTIPESTPATFPTNKIVHCGVFDIYYDDLLATSNFGGFADTNHLTSTLTLGVQRQQTFCAVLMYVQSIFNFNLINGNKRIRLHVLQSYYASQSISTSAPSTTTFIGRGSPLYFVGTGITDGFVADFTRTGNDPAPNLYHAEIQINFDKVYPNSSSLGSDILYNNSADEMHHPVDDCKIDLYSVLLHEVGHTLGFYSFIEYQEMRFRLFSFQPVVSANLQYSSLDTAIQVATAPHPTFPINNPLYTGNTINTSWLYIANSNYYLLGNIAPNSPQILAGGFNALDAGLGGIGSHFDDGASFSKNPERISPGFYPEYVMGPFSYRGVMRRKFNKLEVQTFNKILHYNFNSTNNPFASVVNNTTPYSKKMASTTYNDLYFRYFSSYTSQITFQEVRFTGEPTYMADEIPVDYKMKNDSNVYYDYDIRLDSTIIDYDGDLINITDSTIVNYRGCGNGGNNHNQLTLINSHTIRYTPRHNFYGRAQFGFRINDGKENGSRVLYTIDVERGNNVHINSGDNLVLNGDFEEGTEVATKGAKEKFPHNSYDENGVAGGDLCGNQFADCHPYSCGANPLIYTIGSGIVIKNSAIECGTASNITKTVGHPFTSFPHAAPANYNPTTTANGGDRFQMFNSSGKLALYYLGKDLEKCKHYKLEFDAIITPGNFNNPTATMPMRIGFTNDSVMSKVKIALSIDSTNVNLINEIKPYPTFDLKQSNWQHYTYTFEYCDTTKANILFLGNLVPYLGKPWFSLDNISIKETQPDFAVDILHPQSNLLTTNLTYNINYHCNNLTYKWTSDNTGNLILGTNDNLTISIPQQPIIYILEVSDGCFTQTDTIHLGGCFPPSQPTVTNRTYCQNAIATALTATGSNLKWYNYGSTTALTAAPTPSTANVGTIIYQVTQTVNGCESARANDTVTIVAAPTLSLSPNINSAVISYCNANQYLKLKAISNAAATGNYTWQTVVNNFNQPVSTGIEDSIILYINADTSFKYKVTVTNSIGCSRTDSAIVKIKPCYVQCTTTSGENSCTALSGTLTNTTYTANTKYCTSGNIRLATSSNTTFVNSEIVMEAGTSIIVPYDATLTLTGCHLYSCNAMWRGIEVQAGGTLIIDGVTKSSFIEDADTAVKITIDNNYESAYNNKPPIILKVDNTIFNRNKIGIYLSGTTDYMSNKNTSFIQIGNCVFTSRNIWFSNIAGNLDWVSVSNFLQQPNLTVSCPYTPYTYSAPYINDAEYSPSNYAAYLKAPFVLGKTKPIAGIVVSNPIFKNYSLNIGINNTSTSCNTTVFDNVEIGISNNNNAVNLQNCTFQNGDTTNKKGYGVYATDCGTKQINITTTNNNTTKRNGFWDLHYAIRTQNCQNVLVNYADIQSSQTIATAGDTTVKKGKWGIVVEGASYNNINLSNNNIYNVANGIMVNNTAGSVNANNSIVINNNEIAANTNTQFVLNAITLNSGIKIKNTTPIECKKNVLFRVFNGIKAANWKLKDFIIDSNNITIKKYLTGVNKQYGISFTGNAAATSQKNIISNNTIIGDCNTCNQTGVYITATDNSFVSCNTVDNFKNGFMFEGKANAATKFWDNTMKFNNQNGLTLINDGRIGTQGTPVGSKNGTCTSDNIWEGLTTDWTSRQHFTTLCNNSNPIFSILYTRSNAPYNPVGTNANNWLGTFGSAYSNPSSVKYISPVNLTACTHCGVTVIPSTEPELPENLESLEDIALEDPDLAPTQSEADIILANQQQLFDLLENEPELARNSPILQNFLVENRFGTLDYNGLTNYALSTGMYALADALLNTWQTQATPDQNNYTYYTWLYNIQTNSQYQPPIEDIYAMANQCHLTNGNIVFAARNLYNTLTEQNIDFDVECDISSITSRRKPLVPTVLNIPTAINIYPNPTNGFIFIDLPSSDKTCWQITVTNVFGKTVQEKSIRTKNTKTFIELKGSKGIYFVSVLNCDTGKQETQKIILQ